MKLFSSRHGLNTRGLGSTLNASSASTDDLEPFWEAHGLTNFPIFFRLQGTVKTHSNFQDNFHDCRKLKVFSESHLQAYMAYMAYTICTILGLSLLLRGLSGSLSSSRVASRGLVPHWMKSTRYRTSLAVSTRSISPRITVKQQKCLRPTTQSSSIAVRPKPS